MNRSGRQRPAASRWGRRAVTAGVALAVAMVLLAAPARPAHAKGGKLIDLHAAAVAGGLTGRGGTGDFFRQIQGAGFGAEVGLRLLILDLSVRFIQMVGSRGWEGTLSTVSLGPSVEIPVLAGPKGSGPKVVVRPGLSVGFGFGTLGPVDPPLDAAQVSARGLLVNGRFAVERMIGPVLGLGAEVQGGYHYFFGGVINDGSSHSDGWQVAGFGTIAAHFGI